MSILSDRIRAGLQGSLGRFLSDIFWLYEDVIGEDQYGSQTHTLTAIVIGAPCRLIREAQGGMAGVVGAQESLKDTYRLIAKADVPFAISQKVLIGGNYYNVINTQTGMTDGLFASAILTRQE